MQPPQQASEVKETTDFVRENAFRMLLRVRFGECEVQGVVFNPRYFDYVDVAVTEYLRVTLGSMHDMLARDLDAQVVRQVMEWTASARMDDVLLIIMDIARVGTTSYTLNSEFRHFETGTLIARAETVYVLISAARHTKTVISIEDRAKLENGGLGVVLDLTGLELANGK
jgi:acyl-CoA thioester hydrolase